jgi:hypothetical protein
MPLRVEANVPRTVNSDYNQVKALYDMPTMGGRVKRDPRRSRLNASSGSEDRYDGGDTKPDAKTPVEMKRDPRGHRA